MEHFFLVAGLESVFRSSRKEAFVTGTCKKATFVAGVA